MTEYVNKKNSLNWLSEQTVSSHVGHFVIWYVTKFLCTTIKFEVYHPHVMTDPRSGWALP